MSRIGIDCRLWNETGVGRYIRNLVQNIAKIDKKNKYILFLRREEFETVPIFGENFEKKLAEVRWHTIKEQTKFKKILENEKLDLMHFPYFSYPVFYSGKFVITVHDLILNHFPTGKATTLPSPLYWLKQAGYKFVLSSGVRNARKIIAVSKSTRDEIIDHYNISSGKIAVTYEGIDETLKEEKMEKVDTPHPYFFYVGNAYPHKNLELLVESFKKFLLKTNEIVDLIFVGKEDFFYKRLKEEVEKKGLGQRIHFFQNITDGQLVYLYHHAKAVVLPSLMEGFGLPALEAMANNCLVVASEIPSFMEICGDSAVYFDPYDEDSLCGVLQEVFADRVAVKEKKRSGEKRIKNFSWKKMAEETLKVYEENL
ncbi:MAG TPA: glycosyltransferase family 1 protein [Patescibacteria group bacterium]